MVTFIDRIGYAVDTICVGCIDACVMIKKGVLVVGEEGSRALYEIYSLQGFEKGSKATVANLRAASLIPCCKGVFDGAIRTMEAQKDLIYATLVFESTADFIKVDVDEETGEKSYSFQLPREKDGNIEWVKLLYGIGNFFETSKFLQKYKVYSFSFFTQVATQFGSIKLFSLPWTVGDIPVLNCWCDKPKDFFVFFASSYSAYRCLQDPWNIPSLIKLTGSLGKMVLITSADYMVKRKYFITLTIIDVATQNASLIGFLLKRRKEREDLFKDPTKAT